MKKVTKNPKVKPVATAFDDEAKWDSGQLGRDAKYAVKVSTKKENAIDDSLGLQMISIRIQKELLDDLKRIATYRGLGYQPIIRDVLKRFARAEINTIMDEVSERSRLEERIAHAKAM